MKNDLYSCSDTNPDHRKITLCYYIYSIAIKLLEKLHPKAQSAFLKLPEKSYMELFFSIAHAENSNNIFYSYTTVESFKNTKFFYLLKRHKASKKFTLTAA